MTKVATMLAIWLTLAPAWNPQNDAQSQCIRRCMLGDVLDPEMQRQEIVNLEREAATAILHNDGTFFRRVYSDDFSGTLSHGEPVDKTGFIRAVQSPSISYEAFHASDIRVHIYRETAVATCLWSSRVLVKGQGVSSQMRVMHVYVSGLNGWKVVAGEASALPPYTQQAL